MSTAKMDIPRKTRAFAAALLASIVLLGAIAADASALPAKFWGAVPQALPTPEQFQRLHRGGVESVRFPFDWAALQPTRFGPIDWSSADGIVERAAAARVDLLPFLNGAPTWAVPNARVPSGGGARVSAHLPVSGLAARAWRAFLTQVVERYGPAGSFWAEHPALPERPIRVWQIWNEPNFKYFVARPNPAEYGKLVKASYGAIKAADPGARVILAGLFAQPKGSRTRSGKHKSLNWYASDFLEKMYRTNRGIKSKFNGVALHPYTGSYRYLPTEIEEVRERLKKFKDARKGLWITEMGWSSQPPTRSNIFAKGPAGQAAQLKGAFKLLRNQQAKWRIQRVYWFSVDDQTGVCNFCNGSGLFDEGFVPKRSWYQYVKFAGGRP
jgi:hypothetical protein